jgi:3-hydroxyacyl-CoA dehydrogenase
MTKGLPIKRAAVLGAGVMGRGIAAHLAGVGVEVLLLDIVPPGETDPSPAKRNAFAAGGLKLALKNKPALFYKKEDAQWITVGNLEDDLDKLSEVDWIVEVVKEDLAIKQALYTRIEEVRTPGTLMSSNTSGLPLAELVEGRSDDFRSHFIITHFFNPVRYMKLLEVVSGPATAEHIVPAFATFARETLGKGVVYAKDSPAFVANRVGTFSMMYTVHRMLEEKMSPEAVDVIFGAPMGRAKSAVFRTADVVGLDTLGSVTTHLYEDLPNDRLRDYFKVPGFLATLIEKKWLGSKSRQGCYKKEGKEIMTFDPYTLEYRPRVKPRFDSVGKARGLEDPAARIKAVISGGDEAAAFAWDCLATTLIYAAEHLESIAFDLVQVDNAMKWGFAQDIGPFETWDALGVAETVERMQADGRQVPSWVTDMLAKGCNSFYEANADGQRFWHHERENLVSVPKSARRLELPKSISDSRLVAKNHGARMWDIGDGVACVEFKTKMNAVDEDIVAMLNTAVEKAEADFDALIIGNHDARTFSAGANLMMLMMGAQQKAWDQIRGSISGFQNAVRNLRHSSVPVVAAPFGLTLGGGCEVCLGADALQAHPELYMGLVEVGVGLIPGGGGCFGLLHNLQSQGPDIDPTIYLRDAFMTIGMAKVATSAEEARQAGFLRATDRVTMDRDELLEAAKQNALGLARSDYKAPRPRQLKVAGRDGFGTLYGALWGMKDAGQISDYDLRVGQGLARVLSGGDVAAGTVVTESRFLELEQEEFLSLCGEQKTMERIQYMLMNNKPLRN